ncbi:uncharacterized protein LOC142011369 isoform X3 [Carettochelys insculpta]|uniref:uncharacterized protein LOC142011369 isoform X3 n=1 Tax=Carettochelys insculpta TaxID=44489 RepID=UPI003EB92CAA
MGPGAGGHKSSLGYGRLFCWDQIKSFLCAKIKRWTLLVRWSDASGALIPSVCPLQEKSGHPGIDIFPGIGRGMRKIQWGKMMSRPASIPRMLWGQFCYSMGPQPSPALLWVIVRGHVAHQPLRSLPLHLGDISTLGAYTMEFT